MKVIHVLDHSIPILSGYSIRSKHILEFQRKLGLQVAAVTSPKHIGDSDVEEIASITYYRSKTSGKLSRLLLHRFPFLSELIIISTLYKKLSEILKSEHFDLIHAHSPVLCGLAALKAGRKFGIPVVYEIQYFWEEAAAKVREWKFPKLSLRYRATRYLETKVARSANQVITICQGLRDDLISRGINSSKIYCVPNGVDANRFHPIRKDPELLEKYNLNGCFIIGFIGAFYRYEGIEYIIRALPRIMRSHPNIKVVLVGGGEELGAQKEKVRLEALSAQLGVPDRVIFIGRVPYSEIVRYYSIMDVVAYPRVKSRLTELITPLKPLEPMAMAKVVIASNIGGLRELIKDGETGLLFEPENLSSFEEKCLLVIENEALRKELGARARADMVKNRDWSRIVPRYLEIYAKCLRESCSHNRLNREDKLSKV